MPTPGKVIVVKDGFATPIELAQLPAALGQGFHIEDESARIQRADAQLNEERNTGVLGKATAVIGGLERGATLGLSDAYLAATQPDYVRQHVQAAKEANPGISLGTEIVGAIAPTLLSGGTAAPAGLAAKAGASIAKGGGAGILRGVAGGAVEGGLFGAGHGVSELALSDQPIDVERATSVLSSNILFGAATGGAVGGLARAAEKGLLRAKDAINAHIERTSAVTGVADDLATLDVAGLDAAEATAKLEAKAAQTAERHAIVDELHGYRQELKESEIWVAAKGSKDAEIKEAGAMVAKADQRVRNMLNNPKSLAENPQQSLSALQQQEHAYEKLAAKEAEIRAAAAAEVPAIPRTAADIADEEAIVFVRAKDLEKRGYFEPPGGQVDQVKMAKARKAIAEGQQKEVRAVVDENGRIEIEDGRHRLAAAIEQDKDVMIRFQRAYMDLDPATVTLRGAGDGLPGAAHVSARTAALDKLPAALEKNRALQEKLRGVIGEAKSPRAPDFAKAREAIKAREAGAAAAKESLPARLLGGSVFGGVAGVAHALPGGSLLAPLLGAKASKMATDLVFGRLGNAMNAASKRTSSAIDVLLSGAPAAQRIAPVLATKVLAAVRYAPGDAKTEEKRAARDAAGDTKLHELFAERSAELRSQVVPGATGAPEVRPEARGRIAATLGGIRTHAPLLADRMETAAARRLEFLAAKLPKRPDLPTAAGLDRWRPSDFAMRQFARYASAVEDPGAVEERLAHGTLTPEDVEAYKAVYPERAAELTMLILDGIGAAKGKPMPYGRRLALSMFTGQAVDPAMDPQIFASLQSSFITEPGTEGGILAPKPAPQFGSVKKSMPEPTPAQERSQ